MVKTAKLKGLMAEKGVTGAEMAKLLDIAPKTFYAKMKSGKFDTDQASTMIAVLGIEHPADIFLAKE